MVQGFGRPVLWVQAVVLAVPGIALYVWPLEAAEWWPWPLPALAARFGGSAFLGVAGAAAIIALWNEPRGRRPLAVMAVGTLLVPLTGVISEGVDVSVPGLVALTILLGSVAVVDVGLLRASSATGRWGPLSRPYLAYFAVHLALVLPLGLAMYLLPATMAGYWAWPLSPINIWLIGGIVLASAPLSAMALHDRDWAAVYPTAASYAVFTTLATIAMFNSFGLYDAERLRTWVFFGLYIVGAIGAAFAFVRAAQARAATNRGD